MDYLQLIFEHIFMVVFAVTLDIMIAVPLAIFLYKKNLFVNTTLNFFSLLQAFPVLGMFAILITFLGIGMPVAIFTMFLYGLTPIYINTIHGFKSINPEYYFIIETLNVSKKDVFYKIELPLIVPSIISGIRISTIYTLSLVTVATLIGAGGLGDLIYLGLQQLNLKITLLGVIPILVLTLITNTLLNKLELIMSPADQKIKSKVNYE